MAAQPTTLPIIEKLKGRENFNTWKFAMQIYLEHEDLWKCVEGTETDERKIIRARAKIVLSLDSVNYIHVQTTKTAQEAWNNLCKAFDDSGLTRRVGLLRALITTRLENCDSIDDYVNHVITTAHKLTNIGFEVSDEWIGTLLLADLPDFYKPMIMGLESSGIKITGDTIKTKLLQDVKTSDYNSSVNSESALINKHSSKLNVRNKSASDKSVPRCCECDKPGHYGKNCYKRIARLKKEDKNKKGETSKDNFSQKTFSTILSASTIDRESWYIDSGATSHFTNDKWLSIIDNVPNAMCTVADNKQLPIKSIGNVQIGINQNGKEDTVLVTNVLHVPDLTTNLLSVSKITQRGHTVVFDKEKCTIYDEDKNIVATATEDHGMYKLNKSKNHVNIANTITSNYEIWHRRLGHPSHNALIKMKDELLEGIKVDAISQNVCISCIKSKQHRLPFKSSTKRTTQPLQLVHSDLCGPMQHKSFDGSRYFLTFIDDYTRKVFLYTF